MYYYSHLMFIYHKVNRLWKPAEGVGHASHKVNRRIPILYPPMAVI